MNVRIKISPGPEILVALLALIVYAATQYPGVPPGDSGELIAAAQTLGVAHPPGYPLYLMLAKLATLLPIFSVAARVNFLSGFLDAIAVFFLAVTVSRWSGNRWAGILAGGLFAFSHAVWQNAIRAEVFALNNALAAVLLFLTLRHAETGEARYRRLAVFFFGLGLTNHQTFVFFSLPLVASTLWADREKLRVPREALALALLFLAGLLPYLYLPLASLRASPAQWGDEATIHGFLTHVLRAEYGTFQLTGQYGANSSYFLPGLILYFGNAFRTLLGIGLAFSLLGLTRQLDGGRFRGLAVASTVSFVAYIIFFDALANLPLDQPIFIGVRSRFWQLPDLWLCAWAGLGLATLAPTLKRALPALVAVAVLVPLAFGWKAIDRHDNWVAQDYAASILSAAPSRAIVVVAGDFLTNGMRYLQVAEKLRPDVTVLSKYMLTRDWMKPLITRLYPDVRVPGSHYGPNGPDAYSLAAFVDANLGARPIWLCGEASTTSELPESRYQQVPYGMCDSITRAGEPVDSEAWATTNERAQLRFRNPPGQPYSAADWEYAARDYWDSLRRRADYFTKIAASRGQDPALLQRAVRIYEDILAQEPNPPALIYKHLGLADYHLLPSFPELKPRWRAAWTTYLSLAPPGDRSAPGIRRALADDAATSRPTAP